MNDQLYNVIIPLLITILPIAVISYRDEEVSVSKVSIWGILSFVISALILYLVKMKYYFIHITITVILSTLFNYGVIKKEIDIKQFLKILLVFSLFFFSSIFQLIPIYLFNLDINNLTATQDTMLTFFSDFILLVIIFLIYRREIIDQFKKFKKNLYSYLDTGFKYWLIGLIVMVVSNLLIASLFPNAVAGNEEQVQSLIHGAPLVSFFCVGVLAPIIEEFIFRKAFFDAFKNKKLFILVSGVVFGGLHVIFSINSLVDFLYLIPYCSLGIAFGFIIAKTENIFPSICVHMFHNTCLTLLSIISTLMVVL